MTDQTELIRVPAAGLKNLIILSGDVVGCFTHHWGGRTSPCLPDTCPACDHGARRDWKGYLCCLRPSNRQVVMVEITPATMANFRDAFNRLRTLRGCTLNLTRKGDVKQGKMHAHIVQPKGDQSHLPDPVSQRKFLSRLWRLDFKTPQEITTDEMLEREKTISIDGERLKQA